MRRWLTFLPLAVFALIAAYFAAGLRRDPGALPSALLDQPAPEFALPALAAGAPGFARSDLTGGVTLVNFFASWCGPCRDEHRVLMELKAEGVAISGVAYKDAPDRTQAFLADLGDPYQRVARDADGRTAIDWGVYGVPETYVVDAQGRIRYRFVGPLSEPDRSDIVEPLIRRLGR